MVYSFLKLSALYPHKKDELSRESLQLSGKPKTQNVAENCQELCYIDVLSNVCENVGKWHSLKSSFQCYYAVMGKCHGCKGNWQHKLICCHLKHVQQTEASL